MQIMDVFVVSFLLQFTPTTLSRLDNFFNMYSRQYYQNIQRNCPGLTIPTIYEALITVLVTHYIEHDP